jgi:hypothetical protein
MEAGNVRQFLRWGYSSTGVTHEVKGGDPADCRTPSKDEICLVEERDIRTWPVPQ